MNTRRVPATVVTVTPNPALDETYTVHGLVPGNTHRVDAPTVRAGGKGVNVARVLHQLGRAALAVAPVGGPGGALFSADLHSSGVPAALVSVSAPTRRTLAFVDDTASLTSIFNETGARLGTDELAGLARTIDAALQQAGCLVGSGSLPPGVPADFYAGLVRKSAALGIPCIIDTTGSALLAAAAAGATALKPNQHELVEATGIPDIPSAARSLLARGAQRVFVSCGEAGLLAFDARDPDTHLAAALPEPLPGNPTGAGDAAVAALAASFTDGSAEGPDATARMLRRATVWSAAAVLVPIAGEISRDHEGLAGTVLVTRRQDAAFSTRRGN